MFALVLIVLGCLGSIDYRWSAYGGSALGLIGGAVGVYFGLKRLNSAQERALLVRYFLLLLLIIALGAIGFWLIPGYYRFLVFVPCGLGLFLLIRYTNRRRSQPQTGQPEQSGIASP